MNGDVESTMTKKKGSKKILFWSIAAVALIALASVAIVMVVKKKESYRTLEIIECVGEGTVYRDDKEIAAYEDMKLRSGDTITVGENSYVRMKFDDDKYVYLEGHALIRLVADGTKKDSRTIVDIELGTMITEVQNKLSDKSVYEINSPNTTMAIRGTITVSKVEYELPEIEDAAGNSVQIQKKDVFEYIVKKNKLGKYSEKNTAGQQGTSSGEEQTQEEELLEATLEKVEEVFKSGVKAAVSSFVQEGKVELTTYEKKVQDDGTAVLSAVKVPVEEGSGINTKVEEIIPVAVVSEIKTDDSGNLTINRSEAVEEFLQDVVETVIEVQQVETVEELKEVLTEKIVETIERVEDLNLNINLNQGSISEVIQETQPAWNEMITPIPTVTPTEVPVATATPVPMENPSPTEVPVVTEAPTPTEVPVVTATPVPTENPSPTDLPTPTEVPVVSETPIPSPTEVPEVTEVTEAPSPTPTPSPLPTSTPSQTPSPTAIPSPSPTATSSPTPTATPSPTPTVSPTPAVTPTSSPTSTPSPIPSPTESPSEDPAPVVPDSGGVGMPTSAPSTTVTPSPSTIPTSPSPTPMTPSSTPTSKPTPTPATPSPMPDIGFEYVVQTDEDGEDYVVLMSFSATGAGAIIPSKVTVASTDGNIEIPITEISEDAFADRTDLNQIQADAPMTGLVEAINKAATNNILNSLTVPASVVSSLSEETLRNLKVLSVLPVEGFVPETGAKVLFQIEQCTSLRTLRLPVDLISYVQLTNENIQNLELIIVPGCDGSVVISSGMLVLNMNVTLLEMDGVSLPEDGYVFPSRMKSLTVKNVDRIPDNPLGETSYYSELYTLSLENVKSIGSYAFANCRNLTEINADGVESISENAFSNSTLCLIENSQIKYREERGAIIVEKVTLSEQYHGMKIALPKTINGKFLLTIDTGAFSETAQLSLKFDVVLPYNVYKIASGAFEGSFVSYVVAPGVQTIEANAFKNCTSLVHVETRSLKSLDATAFDGCDKLQGIPAILEWFDYSTEANGIVIEGFSEKYPGYDKVAIPAWFDSTLVIKIADNAFAGDNNLKKLLVWGSTKIGASAFENCDELKNVELLASNSVGERAFYDCDRLSILKVNRTPQIGVSAFESCDELYYAGLSVTREIGSRAFAECTNLEELSMTAVETIGSEAFYNCSSLTVSLPDSVKKIEYQALVGIANTRLYIPRTTEVVAGAIGEKVKLYAEEGALVCNSSYDCEVLPVPGRIATFVGDMYAYSDETVEANIIYGYSGYDNFTTVLSLSRYEADKQYYYRIVQNNVESALENFSQKAQLELLEEDEWTLLSYNSYPLVSFTKAYATALYLRVVDTTSGTSTYYYMDMRTTYVPDTGTDTDATIVTFDGATYQIYDKSTDSPYAVLTQYNDKERELVEIPSEVDGARVTKVGAYAFSGNTTVKWLILPDSCEEIDEHAFEGCTALYSVTMRQVKVIRRWAFNGCTKLREVVADALTTVSSLAFDGCENLYISLPDTVQFIGSYAFPSIKNTSLYIPLKAEVEPDAFSSNVELLYAASGATILKNTSYTVTQYDNVRIRTYQTGDILAYDSTKTYKINIVSDLENSFILPKEGSIFVCVEDYEMGNVLPETIENWDEKTGMSEFVYSLYCGSSYLVWFKYINKDNEVTYFRSALSGLPFEYEEYRENNQVYYKLTRYVGRPKASSVMVPQMIAGTPVGTIGTGTFSGLDYLERVYIEAQDCNVELLAFDQCPNLSEVYFRYCEIGTIASGAFSRCTSLSWIGYESAGDISYDAFLDCPKLLFQPLGTNQLSYVLDETGERAMITGLVETSTSGSPENVSGIYIPEMIDGVKVAGINADAFEDNTVLRRVCLAESIEQIGEGAFAGCTSLEYVEMTGVTKIGADAFNGCSNLTPLLRDSLQEIGSGAFAGLNEETVSSIFVPKDTIVSWDAFEGYTGTIYTERDSKFAMAVTGGMYTVEYKEDSLRLITIPGGTMYAGNYEEDGITGDIFGLQMRVYLEGVKEGATTSAVLVKVDPDQTTLDSSHFELYSYGYENERCFWHSRWNNDETMVMLFKIEYPGEETRYISTGRWKS